MKRYIFVFIATISMYSCCPKDKQKEISPVLIESWIPYQKGDKDFFHNENNELDSTEVVLIEKSFSKSSHWCNLTSETINAEIIGSPFTTLGVRLNQRSITFRLKKGEITKEIYNYNFNKDDNSQVFHVPEFFPNLVIANEDYENVFELQMDSVIVYYGKNIGIIGYKIGESTFTKD